MSILITGNPRSGTRSYANIARQCGIDLGHEKMKKDGTVSCFFFMDCDYYPDGRHSEDGLPSSYDWDEVYLLVRSYNDCIASMCSIVGTSHQDWAVKHGLINYDLILNKASKLEKMMCMWFKTNSIILDMYPQAKVLMTENLGENVRVAFKRDTLEGLNLQHRNRSTGNRAAKPLTSDDLKKESPTWFRLVQDQYHQMMERSMTNIPRSASKSS